ncbi:uncharacterized protein LOC106645759 [Copidosoma floridanum]|uniref:uncharacterized protein LOC106645759 n=1 Tax=Copidosoma floridanum TaxID=29053 RepID=UPI0006C99F25|nr:uncharacterized protein LOC106645759 [Copidosoma floridanum]
MMLPLEHLFLALLAVTSVSTAAVTPAKSVKREIDDARLLSPYTSFPLGVTDTLGTGVLSNIGYSGSLSNVYARDDELFYGSPGYYDYPQYAAGFGNYRGYNRYYDDYSSLRLGLPYYGSLRGEGFGFGSLAGYPYYAQSGVLNGPTSFYGRLGDYYD